MILTTTGFHMVATIATITGDWFPFDRNDHFFFAVIVATLLAAKSYLRASCLSRPLLCLGAKLTYPCRTIVTFWEEMLLAFGWAFTMLLVLQWLHYACDFSPSFLLKK